MLSKDQKIRSLLFYLSLSIFWAGLPFILAFALSYKFNPHSLRFTKAGLIVLKTQPPGARVYLNGRLLNEKTPATVNELLPGEYKVKVELEEYYPWSAEVVVSPGKVSLFDKVILFPLRPDVEQINKENISYFWIDAQASSIYYISNRGDSIYKSELDGNNFREIAGIPKGNAPFKRWKISPDKFTLLCFNLHQIAIVDLKSKISYGQDAPSPYFILDYPRKKIVDVFWHSDSYHMILVTEDNIEVLEAAPGSSAVILTELADKNTSPFYDERDDVLYFSDSARASDGIIYNNLYKLQLNTKFSPFKGLMKLRAATNGER